MDPTVSRSGRFSRADCHDPEHGFSDPRRFSEDENGKTRRHSQTVLDLEDGHGIHWDGEFDTVRELLVARLAPPAAALNLSRETMTRHFRIAQKRGAARTPPSSTRRSGGWTEPLDLRPPPKWTRRIQRR